MIPLVFVIPRLTDSLHPGNGGNPALGGDDMDNTMRMIFYPAIIGWTLLGLWISQIIYRFFKVRERILN
jgi:heme exporter protein C